MIQREVTFYLFLFYFLKMGVTLGSLCGNENDAVGKVFVTWKRKWVI